MNPFNLAAHDFLISAGYTYEHIPCSFEDVGDAENGPELTGAPAMDQYRDADSYVIIDEAGEAFYELRNLEMEKYVKAMGIETDFHSRR